MTIKTLFSSFCALAIAMAACPSCDAKEQGKGTSNGNSGGGVNVEKITLIPFMELNQGSSATNSHADEQGRTHLMKMYSSRYEFGEKDYAKWPFYPRIRKMANGEYILIWQQSNSAGTSNGTDVYYAVSKDLKKWTYGSYLFQKQNNYINAQGQTDTRYFTNGNALVLSNGDLLVVASFRAAKTYNIESCKKDQGIVIKRSSDNGRTWKDEQIIYNGPNWEAHLMELPNNEIHCYFSESRPWISASHSGTDLVLSKDGGKTWMPSLGSEPYRVMRRTYWNEYPVNGVPMWSYTWQMPVGVRLNNSSQMVFAMETITSRKQNGSGVSQKFNTSLVYSPVDGQWKYLTGDQAYTGESDDQAASGTAPYLVQFPSGETVLSYAQEAWPWRYSYKIGDQNAKNFSEEVIAFPDDYANWGGAEVDSPHTMIMTFRNGGTDNKSEDAFLVLNRFALNHNITATPRTITLDADNSDWAKTDEALYLGGISQAEMTLRCSQDNEYVSFLAEVSDETLSSSDYGCIMLSPKADNGKLSTSAICIKFNANGLKNKETWSNGWKSGTFDAEVRVVCDGTVGKNADKDHGYIAEIQIPKSSLGISDSGELLVNLAMFEASVTKDDSICSTSSDDTSKWIMIKGL